MPGVIGASIIEKLIYRDGPKCHWCKRPVPHAQRTKDHLVPKCIGGSDALANLVLACKVCNELRGSTNAVEWAAEIERALADGYTFPAMVAKSRLKNAGRFGLPYPDEPSAADVEAHNQDRDAMREANERIARFARSLKPKPPIVERSGRVNQPGGSLVPPAQRRRSKAAVAYGLDVPEVKPRAGHYVVQGGRRVAHGKVVFSSTCGGCLQPWPCDGAARQGLF